MTSSFERRKWNEMDEFVKERVGGDCFYKEKGIGFGKELLVTPWIEGRKKRVECTEGV